MMFNEMIILTIVRDIFGLYNELVQSMCMIVSEKYTCKKMSGKISGTFLSPIKLPYFLNPKDCVFYIKPIFSYPTSYLCIHPILYVLCPNRITRFNPVIF